MQQAADLPQLPGEQIAADRTTRGVHSRRDGGSDSMVRRSKGRGRGPRSKTTMESARRSSQGAITKRKDIAAEGLPHKEGTAQYALAIAKLDRLTAQLLGPREGTAQAEIPSVRSRRGTPQPCSNKQVNPAEARVQNPHQFEYQLDFLRATDSPDHRPSQNMPGGETKGQPPFCSNRSQPASESGFLTNQFSPTQTNFSILHAADSDHSATMEGAFSIDRARASNQQQQRNMMPRRPPFTTNFLPQSEAHDSMARALSFGIPEWAGTAQSQLWADRAWKAHYEKEIERAYQELKKPPSCLVSLRPILFIDLTPMEFKVVCLSPSYGKQMSH